jgi:crotonobetainyl-CoA:carnitine CoA-transferase CaiB-like acyl-CoA transferase
MDTPNLPLSGLRVLDLTRLPPGAFCTVLLADLGADVIRLESPKGRAFESPVGLGRNKRSVAVDLRHPRGYEVLRQLASSVDVLVENERPGVMEERGFGYAHAAEEMPSLIWCSISGYGQDGPYAEWPGHDLSYTAHSGLTASAAGGLPWYPQLILSIPMGATMAGVGIVAALRERDRTGRGCQIDVSLSESATWLLSSADGAINATPWGIPDGPDRHLYECAEGTWVAVAAAEPRTWAALCEGLGVTELTESLHRWEDPDAVTEQLAAIFRGRRADEWVAKLGPRGAAVVRANLGTDLAEDPQVKARGTLQDVGGVLVPRSPVRFRDPSGPRPLPAGQPGSAVGQDTSAVLAEAGLSASTIAEVREAGAVS